MGDEVWGKGGGEIIVILNVFIDEESRIRRV